MSRVLNDEPHVQESVQKRVRAAVDELGYIPSRSARSLRGNKSYTISLVCHTGGNVYINAIQFGAVLACQDHGYGLQVLLPPPLAGRSLSEIIATLEKLYIPQRPDGILLVSPLANDPTINAAIEALGIPAARVGPVNIEVNGVVVQIDDFKATKEATEHLIQLGHKRIGFIRGSEDQATTHERFNGYCEALREANISIAPELIQSGKFVFESGLAAGEKLLSLATPPTAIFASNDDMAAGTIMAAIKRGLQLPRDLSIVGFDNSEISVRLLPHITTVHQPLRELGEVAISSLIKTMSSKNKAPEQPFILPHKLIVRESTTAPMKS